MSVDSEPRKSPVRPPIANRNKNESAYSIGAASRIDPLYIVASQLKTLMALGMETKNVRNEKIVGILRLSDVFMKVFEMMKQCEL